MLATHKSPNMNDKIICDKYTNISKIMDPECVDLSIIMPPDNIDQNEHFFRELLKNLTLVTKPGGLCCLFVSDQIDPKTDHMLMDSTKAVLDVLDSQNCWISYEKIVWIKAMHGTNTENMATDNSIIDFRKTPFVTIHVLAKTGSKFELINFGERVQALDIPQYEKDMIEENFWYFPIDYTKNHKNAIPEKLVTRLVNLFSGDKQLVLDPFCGNGVTGLVAKRLCRYFLCIDEDKSNCKISCDRLNGI